MSNQKRQYCGTASYSYKLKDACEVLHFIQSSEKEYGVQCNIIRETKNKGSHSYTTTEPSKSPSAALAEAVESICSPTTSGLKNDYKNIVTQQSPSYNISQSVCQQNKEFAVHSNIAKTLFEERQGGHKVRRDVAYLRVTSPGKAFETYEKEKQKIAMTVSAYLELLRFFKSEYRLLENRMEHDYKKMLEKKSLWC